MIQKEEYLKALDIVEKYHKQLNLQIVRLSLTDREAIFNRIKEHEEYHEKGMMKDHGEMIPIKYATMYCSNSFDDGIRWYKQILNEV